MINVLVKARHLTMLPNESSTGRASTALSTGFASIGVFGEFVPPLLGEGESELK